MPQNKKRRKRRTNRRIEKQKVGQGKEGQF